jgi:hypothetical protein
LVRPHAKITSEKVQSIHCVSYNTHSAHLIFHFGTRTVIHYVRIISVVRSALVVAVGRQINLLVYDAIAQHSIHNHCTRDIAWPSNYPLTRCVLPKTVNHIITLKYILYTYAALNLRRAAMKNSFLISRRLNGYRFRRGGFVEFLAVNAISVLYIIILCVLILFRSRGRRNAI